MQKSIYVLAIFMIGASSLLAQRPGSTGDTNTSFPSDTIKGLNLERPDGPDTTILDYVLLEDLSNEYSFRDTTLDYFEDYDPTKAFSEFYQTLGNPASSHRSALYTYDQDIFTQLRANQFSAYHLSLSDMRFFNLNRPYNDLYFSPMGDQSEFLVKAKFSREFKESVNVSLDYLRFTNDGDYQSQFARTTNFGIGFWIRSPKKPYQSIVTITSNNHSEDYNGGHVDGVDFLFNPTNRTTIDVNLAEASLRKQDFTYAIDSYLGNLEKWNLYHRLSFRTGYYKFSDEFNFTGPETKEETFYGSFLTDDRGVRNFQSFDRLQNKVLIGRDESQPIYLAAGITHAYQQFGFDVEKIRLNELSVDGKLGMNLKGLFLKGEASLGLLNATGNLWLNTNIGYTAKKLFTLDGGFRLLRRDTYLQDRRLIVSALPVYDQDLEKRLTTIIYGNLNVPYTKTRINLESLLLTNAVSYDTLAMPTQSTEAITGLKVSLFQQLGWRWIGTDHSLHYQVFSQNIWQLPTFMSKHKLYFQFPIFSKNMDLKFGATFSQYLQEEGIAFMPVTGVFYRSNERLPWYRNLDIFLSAKVDDFRVFVTLDNSIDLMVPDIQYQVYRHAQYDFKVRFGVRWILFD